MSELFPVIARVDSTYLGWEDHGLFTCVVGFDYGDGGHQTNPAPCLDTPLKDENGKFFRRTGTAEGMDFIMRVMEACSVREWDNLIGRTVFVLKDKDGWGSMIVGIRPLPVDKGKEFVFADAFKDAS